MDATGKGNVTLKEWCHHLKDAEIEANTIRGKLFSEEVTLHPLDSIDSTYTLEFGDEESLQGSITSALSIAPSKSGLKPKSRSGGNATRSLSTTVDVAQSEEVEQPYFSCHSLFCLNL